MRNYLEFEKSIAEIEAKIEELSALTAQSGAETMGVEISRLKQKAEKQLQDVYAKLDPWQKTQVARHPDRPRFRDYVAGLVSDFVELSGDRQFGEDAAILGGLGKFMGRPAVLIGHEKGRTTQVARHPDRPRFRDYVASLVSDFVELSGDRQFGEDAAILGGLGKFMGRPAVLIGHEKGRTTQERLKHNFGMALPEGYRKAVRLMDMADRFKLPVITLVDTAGAYPGIGAEERGQAEAIARSTERCLTLGVPMISVIVGEGGSGGAVALAAGNKVLMLEHAIYSVISPEGAASILWKDSGRAKDAAVAMKITAQDLRDLSVIDEIVTEPTGGAHRDPDAAIAAVGKAVLAQLDSLGNMDASALQAQRAERFYAIGRLGVSSNPAH